LALFLVWHEEARSIDEELTSRLDRFELRPGLMIISSDNPLSELYHQIKWALPPATALIVAPLANAPKMKSVNRGALRWLRQHIP
jgi:hypothetical protein